MSKVMNSKCQNRHALNGHIDFGVAYKGTAKGIIPESLKSIGQF